VRKNTCHCPLKEGGILEVIASGLAFQVGEELLQRNIEEAANHLKGTDRNVGFSSFNAGNVHPRFIVKFGLRAGMLFTDFPNPLRNFLQQFGISHLCHASMDSVPEKSQRHQMPNSQTYRPEKEP